MDTITLLQHYWWLVISLLGALLVFLMFVQGGQALLYTIGRTEEERNMLVNSLGRKWEFTFTTLVTFGGAFFASFPLFYSTSFGGAFYVWMAILLCFVIQVARKKDAINDWGSIVALSYIAAQRTLYGYNDMADAKALLESIARSFGYIYGREKHVRINTVSQSPTPTTAGSGVLGLGDLMGFAENMSPLGNASAEDCADYVLTLFSDLTRKVTMQNLYHDGGFSSMGMSRRAMKTYEKGMRFEDVHENQYPFGK